MNKDRVEGKIKDVAGRAQRQVGEWTDDPENQVKGAAKQAEGKVQNAWGKAKDAANKSTDADTDTNDRATDSEVDDENRPRRKAS
jgi:uncharacterized protein YjbJ (UPF0337 family)